MSIGLQLFGILCGIALIAMTFRSLFRRNISEKQTLFWLLCGVVIIIACSFPGIAIWVASFFGVDYAPSIIFMVVLILVIFGLFYCYSNISKLSSRNRDLAIQVSMLNSENSRMKAQLREIRQQLAELGGEGGEGK